MRWPLLTCVLVVLPASARAAEPTQEPPRRMSLIVGVERVFGFVASATSSETQGVTPSVKTESSSTQFTFFTAAASNLYSTPRVAVDANLDGLTLGGSFGYTTTAAIADTTVANASAHADGPTSSAFLIAPRVGHLASIGTNVGVWLRAGVTYWSASAEGASSSSAPKSKSEASGFALTFDPALVFFPIDHVGITATVAIDYGVSGSSSGEFNGKKTESDSRSSSYGGLFGIFAWF